MSLAGKRVLVTRAAEDYGPLEDLLARRGAVPVRMPCVAFEDVPGAAAELARRIAAHEPELVVIASAHAARKLWAALPDANAALAGVQIAAVGRGTAATLAALGCGEVLVPDEGAGAEALVRSLDASLEGRRVLVPRAEGGNPALVEGLASRGARVDAVTLYRTIVPAHADPGVLEQLQRGRIDAVAFASGSAARGFVQLAGAAVRAKIVCMGETCAAEARAAGLHVDAISDGGFRELCDTLDRAI